MATYGLFDAGLRLFGSDGSGDGSLLRAGADYGRSRRGRGRIRRRPAAGVGKFAANGAFEDNLAFADRDKERTFIDSITSGNVHNQIAAGVETALSCMLGRMAGLRRREVTWEELLAHGETYKLGMNLARAGVSKLFSGSAWKARRRRSGRRGCG